MPYAGIWTFLIPLPPRDPHTSRGYIVNRLPPWLADEPLVLGEHDHSGSMRAACLLVGWLVGWLGISLRSVIGEHRLIAVLLAAPAPQRGATDPQLLCRQAVLATGFFKGKTGPHVV